MPDNPIQLTSRTFLSIYNDINSDPELVDKPDWFKRIIAGVGDMLDVYLNATANQSFLRTAFTRQAVADLLALIDYQLTPHTTSSGNQIFYVKRSAILPITIAQVDLAALSQGSLAVSSKRFEALAGKTFSSISEGFTANATTDKLTVALTHYITGDLVRLSTDGTLPTAVGGNLSAGTDYHVIYDSSTTIRLARTLTDAYNGVYIDLTSAGSGNHTIKTWSFSMTCYQQTSKTLQSLGLADATTAFQEFNLPDQYVLESTITLTINSDTWTRVDTFIDSTAASKHFRLLYKADGASYIQFGNGTYGKIPGNFEVFANYAYGGTSESNISTINKITTYAGADTNISGTSNSTVFSGGANEEGIETAKIIAPILLKARDRFVTQGDGKALALVYGGVSIVKIRPNIYGPLSCQVLCVPNGGGTMSAGFKTALQDYLVARTVLDSIDVRAVDPTYVTVNVTSAVKVLSGYAFATIDPFFKLAWRLLFSEITQEILNDYSENGIASATAIINTKWSYSFTSADYAQIQRLLDNVESTDFGKVFYESEVLGFINSYVNGVDYLTTTLSFPVTLAGTEISTAGTMTTSAI